MRWRRTASAVAVALGLLVPSGASASEQQPSPQISILGGTIDRASLSVPTVTEQPRAADHALSAPSGSEAILSAPAPVPLAPIVDSAAVLYVLKTSPPDVLIRYAFRHESAATIERALVIACREGGMGKGSGRSWRVACSPSHRHPAVPFDPSCGADNPTSSASGLVQFMGSWRGWGGYNWSLIVGRDCWEDVQMFKAVYDSVGWGPWQL